MGTHNTRNWSYLTHPCPALCNSPSPCKSKNLLNHGCPVMVWAQVGKEFPDMRQNEREIKFIRVGDIVRTAGKLKGERTLNGGPWFTLIPRVQGVG